MNDIRWTPSIGSLTFLSIKALNFGNRVICIHFSCQLLFVLGCLNTKGEKMANIVSPDHNNLFASISFYFFFNDRQRFDSHIVFSFDFYVYFVCLFISYILWSAIFVTGHSHRRTDLYDTRNNTIAKSWNFDAVHVVNSWLIITISKFIVIVFMMVDCRNQKKYTWIIQVAQN